MSFPLRALAWLALVMCCSPVASASGDRLAAADEAAVDAAPEATVAAVPEDEPVEAEREWHPQSGLVALPGGIAQVNVPEKWLYLPPADAEQLLTLWGNPPGSGSDTLGMLVQANSGPSDPDGWAVIITYDNSGHVTDEDAGDIDYAELLVQMQQESKESNEFRRQEGYPTVELVGWAEEPRYDAAEKKFYWAKELKFEGNEVNTLNYNVRVLGREGVLELNAVAGIEQLPAIRAGMPEVIAMASFVEGQRYADFNESTDKLAGYGLAALVAGGVAAKTGLWAKVVAVLVAGKKLLIPLVIGIGLFVPSLYRRFARRKQDAGTTDA